MTEQAVPKTVEERLAELEQRMANVEIELLFPMAEAEMPDHKIVKRLTMRGAMEKLYKRIFPEESGLKILKKKIVIPGRPA